MKAFNRILPLVRHLCEWVQRRQGLRSSKRVLPRWLPARLPAYGHSRWVLTFSTTVCPGRVRSLGLSKVAQLCGHPEKHWNAWGVSLFLPFEQKIGHHTLFPYIVKSGNAGGKKISSNFAQGMYTYYRKVRKYRANWWQDVPIIVLPGDKHMYMFISFHMYILRVRPWHHNEDPTCCN